MKEGAQERPLGTLEKAPGSQNTSSKESGGQALGTQSRSSHGGGPLGLGLAQLDCRDFCNTWDFRAQLYLTPVARRGTGVQCSGVNRDGYPLRGWHEEARVSGLSS